MHPAGASQAVREAVAHATAGDDINTWHALDRAEAAVQRITGGTATVAVGISFRRSEDRGGGSPVPCGLRRPYIAYAAAADLSQVTSGHRKRGALVLLDLASAHLQTHTVEQDLRVAAAAVDLAASTQSKRVLNRARQFRRTVPASVPPGLLRDFDERLRAANTLDGTMS